MELIDMKQKPNKRQAVYFGDKNVGEIEIGDKEGRFRYHVVFRIPVKDFNSGLAQGHGATPDEAVRDAIMSSREDAQKYLAGLLDLEKEFLESVSSGGQ